jgi:hypothetical protein
MHSHQHAHAYYTQPQTRLTQNKPGVADSTAVNSANTVKAAVSESQATVGQAAESLKQTTEAN